MPCEQRAERELAAAQRDRCACSGARVPPGPARTIIIHHSRGLCFGLRPAPCPLPQVLRTTDSFYCSVVTSLESPFLTSQFKSYSELNHVTWPFKICFIKPSESTPETILLFVSFFLLQRQSLACPVYYMLHRQSLGQRTLDESAESVTKWLQQ